MTPEDWQRVKHCFNQALSLPPAERGAYLEAACGDEPELLQTVQRLLQQDQTRSDPLQQALSSELEDYLEARFAIRPGQRLGAYRLIRPIGEGGMGIVYLAERCDDSFLQQVAIKLLHHHGINRETLQRFSVERQILADLSHPGIARLLDGGHSEQGLPFLVMEYIEGETLTDYCNRHRIGIGQRLRLFEQVCEAVEFAHRHLIVHRDIKPSNILVDEDGNIKLLDFGIAKLLQGSTSGGSVTTGSQTRTELRLLTPENAAPEQVTGESVTTATDVYALGNLLYQLLCESPLFDLEDCNRFEMERLICEQLPLRPSLRITDRHSLAGDRPGSASRLRRQIEGDLDTIALKALQKDPQRRYPDVTRLREDIQRHREHFPILARPDSLTYRARRFLRRQRIPAALVTVLLLSSFGFLLTLLLQSRELERQTRSAELEAASARQASNFLVGVFEAADPSLHAGQPATAEDLLNSGEQKIEELGDQPALQAVMLKTLGRVFQRLGDYDKARQLQQRAYELYLRLPDTDARTRADMLATLADLQYELGDYAASEDGYRRSIRLFQQSDPVDEEALHWAYSGLSAVLGETGQLEEAITLDRQVLAWKLKRHDPRSLEAAEAFNRLGHSLRRSGRLEEAAGLLRKGLAAMRASRGNIHLDTAHSLNQLARTLDLLGQQQEALKLAREGLAIRRQIHRNPHPEVVASIGNVANILSGMKRLDEAIALRREGLELLIPLFGEDHAYVLAFRSSLGTLLRKSNRPDEARAQYRLALAIARRSTEADSPATAFPLTGLGLIDLDAGKPEQARERLQEAYDLRRRLLPADNYRIASSGFALGRAWLELNEPELAEPLLLEAHRLYQATFGEDHDTTRAIRASLVRLYQALDRPDQASRYR